MGDVSSLRGFVDKAGMVDIAQDPAVEHVMIVAVYNDGSIDTAWTKDIKHSQLVFGSAALQAAVNQRVFPHEHSHDDIVY